jgi:hypothetical protein
MLLAPPPLTELPEETLLARLRARRAALDSQGSLPEGPLPENPLAWLYPRLERSSRCALRPYLELEAMHCLLLALRHRLAGEPVPPGLLHQAWLAPELAGLLDQPGDARRVVVRLEKWLIGDYPFATGLVQGYVEQGPGRVEQQLATGLLAHALHAARLPVVRMTIRFLIDLRNLLAVLRHWRWRLRTVPALLPGGEVDARLLARAWAAGDVMAVEHLASRLAGSTLTDLEPRSAERQLLGGLTLRLRRAGRDPLGLGVIIDTVWRCQIAARNRALRDAAGGEDGLLAAALL